MHALVLPSLACVRPVSLVLYILNAHPSVPKWAGGQYLCLVVCRRQETQEHRVRAGCAGAAAAVGGVQRIS
jgi:hypothetical protein